MSKQLYSEALSDAKELTKFAIENAKQTLLEAVTPQINNLIEQELLREESEEEAGDTENFGGGEGEDETKKSSSKGDVLTDEEMDKNMLQATSPPDEEEGKRLNTDRVSPNDYHSEKHYTGPVSQDAVDVSKVGMKSKVGIKMDDDDDGVEITEESLQALMPLMKNKKDQTTLELDVYRLSESVDSFASMTKKLEKSSEFLKEGKKLFSKLVNMYMHIHENLPNGKWKDLMEAKLEKSFSRLPKSIKEFSLMSKGKSKKMNEADLTIKLKNLPDDVDLDTLDVDLMSGDEEQMAPAGDDGLDMTPPDMGGGSDDEMSMGTKEDEDEDMKEFKDLSDDTIVEIDEKMLRREIARMRAGKKVDEEAKIPPGKPSKQVVDKNTENDGEPLDHDLNQSDPIAESSVEEEDEELEEMMGGYGEEEEDEENESKAVKEAAEDDEDEDDEEENESKVVEATAEEEEDDEEENESAVKENKKISKAPVKNTGAKNRLAETVAQNAELRKQLAEANLFNAKLIYTNRLFVNEALTPKQRLAAMERLDVAKTIREVKLIYTSLVKTLGGSPKKANVSESRVIGSSSRPTGAAPSSAPSVIEEGVEAARWAKLAGLK